MSKTLMILDKGFFLALIFFVSIIGLIIPYGFPLFSLLVFVYFFIYFILKELSIKLSPTLLLLYLSIILYFVSLLFNKGVLYRHNYIEVGNIFSLLLILMIISSIRRQQFNFFLKSLMKMLTFTIPLIALFSLYKYYLLLNGIYLEFLLLEGRSYPWGTTLMPDYNMFALGMIIGVVFISNYYEKTNSFFMQMYCLFGILVTFFAIILSGSRRGWITLVIVILYVSYVILKKFLSQKNNLLKNFFSLSIIICGIIIIVSLIPISNFDDNYEVEKIIYRFSTLLNAKDSFSERTDRWTYGLNLIDNRNVLSIFIGSGFAYLNQYADRFKVEGGEDYPHNPIISTMLYSGVLGSTIIILLMSLISIKLVYYKKYFGKELILTLIISLIFLLPSANTIFTIKLLLLLIAVISIFNPKPIVGEYNEKSTLHCSTKF